MMPITLRLVVGFGLLAGAVIASAAAGAVPDQREARKTAANRTILLHWTDVQALSTGGRLVYRASRITISGDRYSVAASMTNRTTHDVRIRTYSPTPRPRYLVGPESFGIAYREKPNPNITTRHLLNARAAKFSPSLPTTLAPGASWRGTFSGQASELRRHHEWWIVYGYFDPGGYWVSDKTFAT